ncbi:MAG: flavin reductase [Bacteroidetes bacterium QS_9_68_14]|nr:MAG: flavin reductase [Bacteroidetes bacterium QS_9_68_14]
MNTAPDEPTEEQRAAGGAALRAVMREVPSPVTVVTARAGASGNEPFGITIGSLASVSLEPPLVSFNVSKGARTYEWIDAAERFAVHVLRKGQAELAERFADPGLPPAEQFAGLAWHAGPEGRPVLDGTLAVLRCRVHSRIRAGDSDLVVGRVTGTEDPAPGSDPLVYHRGGYRTVAPASSPLEATNRSASRAPETPAPKSAKS